MTSILPTVHLNGTSKKELETQQCEAHNALEKVITVVCKAAPHSRDYYVQKEPGAFARAQAEHEIRIQTLMNIQRDIMKTWEHIDSQGA